MVERRMVCHNCGIAPTFLRGSQKLHIDLTLHTEGVVRTMKEWKALEHENMSDHQDIVWVLSAIGKCTRGDGKKDER